MNRIIAVSGIILISIVGSLTVQAKVWTLKDCIEYAIQNNITIRKTSLQHQSAIEDVHQSQA
ncbi:MAG: TolC family protein, partial [Prevotella sp.]|nr:TolC family protein [Prevotella sp.]